MSRSSFEIYALRCSCHPESDYRYVGQTVSGYANRLREHRNSINKKGQKQLPVVHWIRKHGPMNITSQLVESCNSREEVDDREAFWIVQLGTNYRLGLGGLNLSTGGAGCSGHRFKNPHNAGELSHMTKLTREQVVEIKSRLCDGESPLIISKDYPCNNRTISNIAWGKTWSSVPFGRAFDPLTMEIGRKRSKRVADEDSVRSVRVLSESGLSYSEISQRTGLTNSVVGRIVRGDRYSDIE